MRDLRVVSDNTSLRRYELDEKDSVDILELAMKYGRGESGEIVELYVDNKRISRCYWDWQYRKYRHWK